MSLSAQGSDHGFSLVAGRREVASMKGSKGVKGRKEGTRGPGKNILGSILYLHRGSLRGASCQVIEVKSLALGGFWRQLPIFFGS